MGSRTETVQVRVAIDNDCSGILRFIIDTGSDWTVIGLHHLTLLHLLPSQLKKPTAEMQVTVTATGEKMTPEGYVYARFYFGQSYVDSELVVFRNIKTPLLSIDVAKKLNIVHINTKGSPGHPEFEAKKYAAGATQNTKSILTPFNKGKIFLNCETRCSSSTIDPEGGYTKLLKQQILQEYDDVFESQPPMKGEKFKIVLRDDAIPCCISKARQIPVAFQQALKNELDELLAEGIITPVTEATEWVNPIVVEPKRDQNGEFNGKVRLCVDFRHLNKYCLREHYFSPSVLDVVQSIQANDAHLFSSFDAWKGYHQIELAEESKHLTTFLTPFGRFQYERAPFGINSISEHYNRRMSEELHDLPNTKKIVDDNIVYSSNSLAQHTALVKKFLTRCREAGIRLQRNKFIFAQPEITFAGIVLNHNGYRMQDKVIKAIRDFKKPESLTDLQSFQGMANQLAPFNRDLATALQPLRPLLQKNAQPFHMNDEQTLAFENAKAILTSNNVIAYYRPGAPLRLFTDASLKHGLGFYLKQQQTDNDWKTIQTGSRTLTPAETRYAPIELELQAIVYATKKCHNFLAGTKFNLFTDHRPLVSICNKRRLDNINNSRILRSLLKLMDYNFTVNYIPGPQNKVADSFSRNPVDNPDETDQQHVDSQAFFLRICRLSQAEMADCSFRLEQLKEIADNDVEYQLLKAQINQGFPQNKCDLSDLLHPYWNVREDLLVSDDGFVLKGTRLLIPHEL